MSERYVLLTGARNNAGDFLIGDRARNLLRSYRPDRELIDFDAWKPLSDEQLAVINASKALLLTGGPALQPSAWPNVYPLTDNLSRIKVPIVAYGLGWKARTGNPRAVSSYKFTPRTLQLLERIDGNSFPSSVRDYHTWEVLRRYGFNNFEMTGCPALYEPDCFDSPVKVNSLPERIVFSLGVEWARSARLLQQTKELIRLLAGQFGRDHLTVAFHHSLDDRYSETYGKESPVSLMQRSVAAWLDSQGIFYRDISGELDAMLEMYASADLHVGYRIHAHILMLSLSKPSAVISEDGRGIALKNVTGGLNFDAFLATKTDLATKVLHRLGVKLDRYRTDSNLPEKVISYLISELRSPALFSVPRTAINEHFTRMKSFLLGLP